MIIENKLGESDFYSGKEKITNHDSKFVESDMKIVELDGQIFRVKKIFATEGRTILEGVVSMLLDRMENQDKIGHA